LTGWGLSPRGIEVFLLLFFQKKKRFLSCFEKQGVDAGFRRHDVAGFGGLARPAVFAKSRAVVIAKSGGLR
jgi:hypothetical protein